MSHDGANDASRTSRARIGISGWHYGPWRGRFYPKGLPHDRELAFAAERFDSIELNGSFYSLQRPESYERWYEDVPRDFKFAIKGSRYITHMLRLQGVEVALANFFASGLLALRDKLGPILWQLPPSLPFEAARLRAFFEMLPRRRSDVEALVRRHDKRVDGRVRLKADENTRLRHALEVRHPGFAAPELVELLREHQIALVVADTAGRWPLLEDVTTDFVYVRLHGDEKLYESGYTDEALDRWAKRIDAWLDGGEPATANTVGRRRLERLSHRDVFVYFDNDVKVHAPYDALSLARKISALRSRSQRRGRERQSPSEERVETFS